ncbi:septal ring lytic transglycosylase RlpA family protein [Steroidobacter sp.]|uniref:septal ring lytic transglycosylase RlpA family protein n=1 Tax=Steroidobacter sp. TaxID=1978227 RepID=UPI002ED84A55
MQAGRPSTLQWLPLALALVLAGCVTSPPIRAPKHPPPSLPPPSPIPAEIENIPDPVPRSEPKSARGNPPFYTVLGKRYHVLNSAEGYQERGVASWYGPGFHAASTSNGERYDMYAMTAAHKTLPLPAYVQVTNLKNGKHVIVRVNDRGPFKEGRIIDLSYTAAAKLDMIKAGTAFVEVRALTPVQKASPPAAPAATSDLYVQAGAFGTEANATRLLGQLRSKGVSNAFVRADEIDGKTLYRVRVGPIPTVNEFDRVVSRLRALGVSDARLAAN